MTRPPPNWLPGSLIRWLGWALRALGRYEQARELDEATVASLLRVLPHMGRHIREPVKEQAPDTSREIAVADQRVFEIGVMGRGVDGPVDPHVQGHQLVRPLAPPCRSR